MTGLSELTQRMLAELQEAHAENICCLMNTVYSTHATEFNVRDAMRAIDELVDLGLADMACPDGESGRLIAISKQESLKLINALADCLVLSGDAKKWSWLGSRPIPELLASDAGLVVSDEILTERGYQWWRQ